MVHQTISPPTVEPSERRISMSYDDYLAWHEEEGNVGEWVNGEVIVFVPRPAHQRFLFWFAKLFSGYVELLGLGEVLIAPVELRLSSSGNSREPDLVFLLSAHLDRVTDERIEGTADVVVEIVSPGSVLRDRRDKLAEYAAAGIPEYWLLDPRPERRSTELFVLTSDRVYERSAPDATGRLRSTIVPGFWLDPNWLRSDQLPRVDEALAVFAAQTSPER